MFLEVGQHLTDSASSKAPLSGNVVIAIFSAFLLATIFILFIKKICYRLFLNKRYYIFPKMSVKGITNVAMVISISIAAIILLTFLTAGFMAIIFRAYPGWRATIEGILIKIGGLLFGPIIGVFVGAFTDLLTVAMTAGMFHYGYFVVAISYGFFSGIVRTIINLSNKRELPFLFLSTLFITFIYGSLIIFINYTGSTYTLQILGYDMVFSKEVMLVIFACLFTAVLVGLWVCSLVFDFWKIVYWFANWIYKIKYSLPIKRFRRKLMRSSNSQKVADDNLNWVVNKEAKRLASLKNVNCLEKKIDFNKTTLWFNYFAPVFVTVFACEAVVEVFIMPVFDIDVSALPYDYWFAFRLFMLTIMIPINILVIFPIYRIVCPSMKYNYQKDLSESIYVPFNID